MVIVSCEKKKKPQEDPLSIVHGRDEAGKKHGREAEYRRQDIKKYRIRKQRGLSSHC